MSEGDCTTPEDAGLVSSDLAVEQRGEAPLPAAGTAACVTAFDFKAELVSHLPAMRAFARGLSKSATQADDLTQEAAMRAWSSQRTFEPGTNMRAWLFTILRNVFFAMLRRTRNEHEPPDAEVGDEVPVPADQDAVLALRDFRRALARLPAEQREALMLVGANGYSYREAAEMASCQPGTMKSRVCRARKALAALRINAASR